MKGELEMNIAVVAGNLIILDFRRIALERLAVTAYENKKTMKMGVP
jgi:hypothetical protein